MQKGYDKFFKDARKASASGVKRSRPDAGRFKISPDPVNKETPEARLKKVVAQRVRQRRDQVRKKRAPLPWGAFTAAIVGLGLAVVGVAVPETMDWVMDHIEIGVYGEAHAESAPSAKAPAKTEPAAEKTAGPDAKAEEKSAAKTAAAKGQSMPDTRQWTAEEISFFNKLGERKRQLDLREAELNKLDEELQRQKLELDAKIKQLEEMRSQIAQTLKTRVDTDQEKVSKLVEVYSGMKPQQAAKVMETINEDLAVQILDRLKKKSAADILNVMDAKKAQHLSEMLAGYKRP